MKQFTKRRPPGPAKELDDLLVELDWSNAQLAECAHVTQNTVSRWLHRWTSPPILVMEMVRRRAAAKRRKSA